MTMARNVVTRTPAALAEALRLTAAEAEEWQVQYALLKRLRQVVEADSLTHAEVARRGKSSRTRVTAILNGNLDGVSTDLLIRLLSSIGYRVRVSVSRIRPAA